MSRRLLDGRWLRLDLLARIPDRTADHHGRRAGAARMGSRGWGLVQPLLQVLLPLGSAHLVGPMVDRPLFHAGLRHDRPIAVVRLVALVQQKGRDVHALLSIEHTHRTGEG